MNTILWQRIEGGLVFAASMLALFSVWTLGSLPPWWLMLLVFFAPDLSFIGYLAGPKVGAALYNIVHLYAFGVIMVVIAISGVWVAPSLLVWGLLILGHAGFDRMFGYGLKEPSGFNQTHLGPIGHK